MVSGAKQEHTGDDIATNGGEEAVSGSQCVHVERQSWSQRGARAQVFAASDDEREDRARDHVRA